MKFKNFRRKFLSVIIPEWLWKKSVNIDGVDIPIRHMFYSFGIKYLLSRKPNNYELPERMLVRKVLKKGDQVLEMGGSIGVLTRIMADIVGSNGRILSIEASSFLANNTKSKIPLQYPHVTIVNAYGFPIFDKVDLNIHFDDSLGSLGGIVHFTGSDQFNEMSNCFFISDCKLYGIKPTIIVIDIEGSEKILLDYDPKIPSQVMHIIIELHSGQLYNNIVSEKILLKFLMEGFSIKTNIGNTYLLSR